MSPSVHANGIDLWFESLGDEHAPTLVLIGGVGNQAISWDDDFCDMLVERGFRVVRFDHRDIGLSEKLDVPYDLKDMAADVVALLDVLGVMCAHLVGRSMGGMIAQVIAIEWPDRVASMCLISTTTGSPSVGRTDPSIGRSLLREPDLSPSEAVAAMVEGARLRGSKTIGLPTEKLVASAAREYRRSYHPAGSSHHIAAIVGSPDRTMALADVDVPTVVVHGTDDLMIDVSGGKAVADAIPDAELILIEGLAHDLPPQIWTRVVDAVVVNSSRATS